VSRGLVALALVALPLAGCATRGDLLQQDRTFRQVLNEQRKQLQSVQREVERLRADVDEAGGGRRGGAVREDRLAALEQRVQQLEMNLPGGAAVPGETPPVVGVTPAEPAPASPPIAAPAGRPAAPAEDDWRRDVAREQTAAGSANVAERAEYLRILDGVAAGDCARVVPQLNGFASTYKDSPLADNALYWAARCYARRGDQNQAVAKFYDVVTRYPKGDKAPAALLAQGELFVGMGDSPDARLALSKLVRDYPQSEEAPLARQRLGELED
jgi:tol-pal system protein YbgF